MFKQIVAGAVALGAATTANAAVVYPVGTPGVIAVGQQLINAFETTAEKAAVTGTGFVFRTQAQGSEFEGAPIFGGDQSTYLSVVANGNANVSTILLGQDASTIFLDIGSVDEFNTVTLNFADGTSQSFTGMDIANPANGSQTSPVVNGRFAFDGQGKLIRSINLASGQNSLEVDNLAVAVPEPATWGMMILGFGLLGAAMRRRNMVSSVLA